MHADYRLVNSRSLFVLTHEPSHGVEMRGTIIFVQSLFDEMNRSRPVIAACARKLAAKGWRVVLPDLYGCGDSEGDLQEATIAAWVADMGTLACAEAQRLPASSPTVIWGLRFGGLIAAKVSSQIHCSRLILWSPALNGEHFVDQILRMRSLASEPGTSRESRSELWALLRNGQSLEVGGYCLAPELALPIAAMRLSAESPKVPVILRHFALPNMPSRGGGYDALFDGWRHVGVSVDFHLSEYGPFWRQVGLSSQPDAASWLSDFDL